MHSQVLQRKRTGLEYRKYVWQKLAQTCMLQNLQKLLKSRKTYVMLMILTLTGQNMLTVIYTFTEKTLKNEFFTLNKRSIPHDIPV